MRGAIVALLLALPAGCADRSAGTNPTPGAGEAAPAPAPISGRHTFVIVPGRSQASYRASEEFFAGALDLLGIQAGTVSAVGSTGAVEGTFQLDPERPNELAGESSFAVRVNTFVSNQPKRDDYVREVRDDGGPSFDAYPVATFRATGVQGSSVSTDTGRRLVLRLAGDLTMRDVTRPVVFDADAQLAGTTLTGTARTRVMLSEFGIGPIAFSNILSVSDEVELEVRFTAEARDR